MLPGENRALTAFAYVAIAFIAGLLTWLCVGWFGDQPLVTALMAILLVELCLACFGVIAMLLTERVTVTLMKAEGRPAAPRQVRPKREPIWLRLPDAAGQVPAPATPTSSTESIRETIAFPQVGQTREEFSHRRAA